MVWQIRADNEIGPIYGPGSNLFTIMLRHSGRYKASNGRKYFVGGDCAFIDNCDEYALKMPVLHLISRQVGLLNWLRFSYSPLGLDASGEVKFITTDMEAGEVLKYMKSDRLVCIYVEDLDDLTFESEGLSQCSVNFNMESDVRPHPHVVESTDEMMGCATDGDGELVTRQRGTNGRQGRNSVGERTPSETDEMPNPRRHVDMIQLDDANESEDDSGSEEPEDSDYGAGADFEESDFEYDDELYAENIDKEVEWAGFTQQPAIEVTTTQDIVSKQPNAATKSKRKPKFRDFVVYEGNASDSDFEFEVGMKFKSASEFRDAMRKYSNHQGKPVRFKKNNTDKIKMICNTCDWVLYASFVSKIDHTFQVKNIEGIHTCQREHSAYHCTSRFLAQKYIHHLRSNPEWPVESMLDIMEMENRTLLSIAKMYRTKNSCNRINNGLEMDQYAHLWDYCEEIRRSNPGTTVKIKAKHVLGSDLCVFKKLYLCWGAVKKGFLEGCRPLIGLDGTHLKTNRGGVLLSAVGIDGNNNMYPIAYAIVKKETTKTWSWFLELLKDDLNIANSYHWSIISDRQKGLIKAVEELLPNSEHRFCLRHMYQNMQKKHKGLELKELVWAAANATRVVDFDKEMETIKRKEPLTYEWLRERPPKHWSKSHFSTWPKCDMLLNNFCEGFNKVILKARNKPIIPLLETLRLIMYKRMPAQRDKVMRSSGNLCPAAQKILDGYQKHARDYRLQWNGEDKFEVTGWKGDVYNVDLPKRSCSCNRWELTGLPCVHGVSCINYVRGKVEDYVEHWYKKSTYIKAYSYMLQPINGRGEWPKTQLVALSPWPEKPKKRGRPKKYDRRKDPSELIEETENGKRVKRGGSKYVCSNCGNIGHNKKSCKNQPLQRPPKLSAKKKTPASRSNQDATGDSNAPSHHASSSTQTPNPPTAPKPPAKKRSKKAPTQSNVPTPPVNSPPPPIATRYFRMDANTIVTQLSDDVSTITRVYK